VYFPTKGKIYFQILKIFIFEIDRQRELRVKKIFKFFHDFFDFRWLKRSFTVIWCNARFSKVALQKNFLRKLTGTIFGN